MSKVSVIGNFCSGIDALNGQTVKTKIVTEELIKVFGENEVVTFNTSGGIKTLFRAPFMAWKAMRMSHNIIFFPAENSLRVFIPLLLFLQLFLKQRKVHYVVIGGWLPAFLKNRPLLRYCLQHIYMIYAETHRMHNDLEKMGFCNVSYMPNCKPLKVVSEDVLFYTFTEPYKLCTFSRVWSQKGIGEAAEVVKIINQRFGRIVFTLDIYGMVESGEEQWFDDLQAQFPEYIKYGGAVPFEKSVDVLKNYFALLFPTKCPGEGIPGTIIDAYAAGIPVISSLYPNFGEIIDDGKTGLGYEFNNKEAFLAMLVDIAEKPQRMIKMKKNCIEKAKMFQPNMVINRLVENICGVKCTTPKSKENAS